MPYFPQNNHFLTYRGREGETNKIVKPVIPYKISAWFFGGIRNISYICDIKWTKDGKSLKELIENRPQSLSLKGGTISVIAHVLMHFQDLDNIPSKFFSLFLLNLFGQTLFFWPNPNNCTRTLAKRSRCYRIVVCQWNMFICRNWMKIGKKCVPLHAVSVVLVKT